MAKRKIRYIDGKIETV